MKKTINSKIVRVLSILLFSCFFASVLYGKVLAAGADSINIYSNIYNASEAIDVEFTYEIIPDSSNPVGASNEPTTLVVKFDNVDPVNNLTTVTGTISFANTVFQRLGVYRYTIKETASSNSDYPISSEKYEIYVTYSTSGLDVSQQAKNLFDYTKGNVNFNHEPNYSYSKINLSVVGDTIDKREYFRFKIYIDSMCLGCEYDVLGQDEYVNYNGSTIKTSDKYTVLAKAPGPNVVYAVNNANNSMMRKAVYNNNEASRRTATYTANDTPSYIYLKDGQSVTIGLSPNDDPQIPMGTLIRVIGDENLSDRKWTMYINGAQTKEFEHRVGRDMDFNIVLERNMLVPDTGVFVESLPYLILILMGGIGLYSFIRLKKKNAKQNN